MQKTDFKKTLKHLYAPSAKEWVEVDVPPLQYLMVDGMGSPGEAPEYFRAVEWLFSLSYPLKFMSKKELQKDYAVPPLEGLWWADDMASFLNGDKDSWKWTMMIMQPDWITPEMFAAATDKARGKMGEPPASLRLETYDEGLSVQIMYVGAYADEGPTIARLHNEFLPENGLAETGHHHEIYLGDPRRIAPDKLKTVIRQPVRRL